MSLDVTILSADGRPTWTVPIGMRVHVRLAVAARRLKLTQLSRIHDYYEDLTIELTEVANLINDLETLLKAMSADHELSDLCQRLLELARRAMNEDKAIEVIAD